jgi:drug/metabolite transporter (DMT)-like permease
MPDPVLAQPRILPTRADAIASHRLGVLLVAGAALWWSTGGLFIRSVQTDQWTTIFWRSVFASATLFLFIAIRKRRDTFAHFRAIGWPGLVMALCFCGASSSYVPAVLLTSVANTLILQSVAPFVAAALGFLLMREPVRSWTWAAMVVSIGGIYVMVGGATGGGSLLGNLLGFGIALFYGAAIVVTRFGRQVQMLPASCLASLFAVLLSGTILALSGRPPWPVAGSDLACLAGFGALQLAGGMLLFTYGARLIPAAESALLSIIETVGAPIWVFVFFGEDPGGAALVGGGIVLAAVVACQALELRRQAQAVR